VACVRLAWSLRTWALRVGTVVWPAWPHQWPRCAGFGNRSESVISGGGGGALGLTKTASRQGGGGGALGLTEGGGECPGGRRCSSGGPEARGRQGVIQGR
jgi:hypothetical protein